MNRTTPPTLIDAARQATAAGLSIVPPVQDGTKRPRGQWKTFQQRHPTRDELNNWYANTNTTGIGVVCGAISGNLEMLEFEGRALDILPEFEAAIKRAGLADLWQRITGGYSETTPTEGLHVLYKCEEPVQGNLKLASTKNRDVLIETRGEGGYTICAPTGGDVHPTGRPWKLDAGSFATIATITAEERADLLNLARSFDKSPAKKAPDPAPVIDGERPGDIYNTSAEAPQRTLEILHKHGWTVAYTQGDAHYLRRPGKTKGISATLNYVAPGVFYVFTTSTEFEPETGYSPFQVFALLEHNGDFRTAATTLAGEQNIHTLDLTQLDDHGGLYNEPVAGVRSIIWHNMLAHDYPGPEWTAHKVIPKGRETSISAQGKAGKSLLLLDIALNTAAGTDLLGYPTQKPSQVIYLDQEMALADLEERITDMGYDIDSPHLKTIEQHLHYFQNELWYPLDTQKGGAQLLQAAMDLKAETIILDTLIRLVEGEENSADTIARFHRHTISPLKQRAITIVRADHTGKDAARGARGTSAKRDDVDLAWTLKENPVLGGVPSVTLRRDASRIPWVDEHVILERHTDPLRHVIQGAGTWSITAAALDVLKRLHALEASTDISHRSARELLKANGGGVRNDTISEALNYLKVHGWEWHTPTTERD